MYTASYMILYKLAAYIRVLRM